MSIDYNFMIWEDRKFADICSTNIQQMNALKLETYADIVICHAITGFEFVNHCELPVLLVSQLSNKGNLINENYTEKCIEGAFRNKLGLLPLLPKNLVPVWQLWERND